MRIFTVIFMLILLISCKEEIPPKVVFIPKIEINENGKIIPIDSSRIAKIKDSNVIAFYFKTQYKTFWQTHSNRENINSLLNTLEQEGLFSKDFDLKKIENYEKNKDKLSNTELIDFDILLTENLNLFIQKASKGGLDPKKLYTNWDLIENNTDLKKLLLNFQKKDSFNYALSQVLPNHIVYKKLKSALIIINSLPKFNFNSIEIENKIVLNDTNETIIEIKKKLIYWKDLKTLDTLTPIYDDDAELAIKKFQMRHGLAPDGVIGFGTAQALNISKEERKKEIIANMERWRWFPRQLESEYLIINIPDYTLHIIKNSDTLRTHKVIIGRTDRKTPVLSSKLTHLVFNPTWTIPPTILRNDVIPAAKNNRNYFATKNITIYNSNNQVINPSNWDVKNAKQYRYVQSPGPSNSLGLVKFSFPNRFSVYLHDTNSRGYFDKEIRALSSGCVRVQYPFELTEYLLDDSEKWNLEKINDTIDTKKTIRVNLNKEVYIHILYWTAWSENGILQFRDDLYNLDADLYKKLN